YQRFAATWESDLRRSCNGQRRRREIWNRQHAQQRHVDGEIKPSHEERAPNDGTWQRTPGVDALLRRVDRSVPSVVSRQQCPKRGHERQQPSQEENLAGLPGDSTGADRLRRVRSKKTSND